MKLLVLALVSLICLLDSGTDGADRFNPEYKEEFRKAFRDHLEGTNEKLSRTEVEAALKSLGMNLDDLQNKNTKEVSLKKNGESLNSDQFMAVAFIMRARDEEVAKQNKSAVQSLSPAH